MKLSSILHKVVVVMSFVLFTMTCRTTKITTTIIKTDLPSDSTVRINQTQDPARERRERDIREKYSKVLGIPPENIKNMRLYFFIDHWLNTPYLWAGNTEAGIDCSAFIQRLLADVYNIQLPRTSITQFFTDNVERFGSRHSLQEGDLVFFSTTKDKLISHVGLYLANRKFVNAASSKGVSIANMDNLYWDYYYRASGRVIIKKKKK